jgi:hypothetical protein
MTWGQSLKSRFNNIQKSLSFTENPTAFIHSRIDELQKEGSSWGQTFKILVLKFLHFFSALLFPTKPEEASKPTRPVPVSSSFFTRTHVAPEPGLKFAAPLKTEKNATLPRKNICTAFKEATQTYANTACSMAQSGFGLFQSGLKSAFDSAKSLFTSSEPTQDDSQSHKPSSM